MHPNRFANANQVEKAANRSKTQPKVVCQRARNQRLSVFLKRKKHNRNKTEKKNAQSKTNGAFFFSMKDTAKSCGVNARDTFGALRKH